MKKSWTFDKYHMMVMFSGLLWSSLGVFSQLLTNNKVDLFSQVWWRLIIAFLSSAGLAFLFRQSFKLKRGDVGYLLINALIFVAAYTTFPLAIYFGAPIARAVLLVYAFPLTVVPLGYLILGDKPSGKNILAILLTVLSLMIVFKAWTLESFDLGLGDVFALINSFFAGLMIVWGAKMRRKTKMGSMTMMMYTFLMSLPFLALSGWLLDVGWNAALFAPVLNFDMGISWWWLLGIGILPTTLSVGLLYVGSEKVKPSVSGVLLATEPVWTYLWGWWLFGQMLDVATIVGGFGILLSVLLV